MCLLSLMGLKPKPWLQMSSTPPIPISMVNTITSNLLKCPRSLASTIAHQISSPTEKPPSWPSISQPTARLTAACDSACCRHGGQAGRLPVDSEPQSSRATGRCLGSAWRFFRGVSSSVPVKLFIVLVSFSSGSWCSMVFGLSQRTVDRTVDIDIGLGDSVQSTAW